MVSLIQLRNKGTADVMPYAEHGTWDGGQRIGGEVQYGQRRGKS